MSRRKPRTGTTGTAGEGLVQPSRTNGDSSFSLISAMSAISSRLAYADALHGTSHSGKRNYYSSLGYPTDVSFADYRREFRRGGIAKRLIKLMPNLTWSDGAELVENENPNTSTALEESFTSLADRLSLYRVLRQADILQQIGEYSVVLIGGPGRMETPLPRMKNEASIAYLKPYSQDRAEIDSLDAVTTSPRYGLPEFYLLKPESIGSKSRWKFSGSNSKSTVKSSDTMIRVHWSRILHVCEDPLEDDLFSDPLLEPVWNYLLDLNFKVVGGGSEASWKRADPGYHLSKNKDYQSLLPDDRKLIKEEWDKLVHDLERTAVTEGVDLKVLDATVDKFGANADTLIGLICMTLGFPKNVLEGNERGLRASETESDHLNAWKSHRQQTFATPLLRMFVDRMVEYGAFPAATNKDGYKIVWAEEEELSLEKKAEVTQTLARANQAQGENIVTPEEIRDTIWGLEPLEEEVEEGEEGEQVVEEEEDAELEDSETSEALLAAASSSPSNSWDVVLSFADRAESSFASSVLGFWSDASNKIDESLVDYNLRAGDLGAAISSITGAQLTLSQQMGGFFSDRLVEVYDQAAEKVLKFVTGRGSWFDDPDSTSEVLAAASVGEISTVFNSFSPRAVQWAKEHAASLVTKINFSTAQTLRGFVSSALQNGIPPKALARTLRDSVGLLDRQVKTLGNLRQRLLDAEPGSLVYAGKTKIRVPKDGFDKTTLESKVQRYAAKLKNDRAKTIARTETLNAANRGQVELWKQAVEQGDLPSTTKRMWMATNDERARDEHEDVNGEKVGIDEPFSVGVEPGQEVNCRCAQGLVRK